jgi:serine-type D-Ala-D-Ala carboxypeptidase (penicillin-binding protein 5/6)
VKGLIVVAAAALALASTAAAAVPAVNARAFLVVDAKTGDVLAQRNANVRVPIASITKLMTVLITLEHARLNDVVTVQHDAAEVGESTINLRAGERITVRELLAGALIQSANDAADALADYVGHGNDRTFVAMMNAKAKELGLVGTHFVRPDGLDAPGHVSSARDVALLARVAMHSPVVREIVAQRSAPIEDGTFTVRTWNDLLGVFPGMIGVKTGHTSAAGWCEVAAVRRSGYTIYAVVLGVPTRGQRNDDLQRLLAWGVAQYRPVWLVRARTYAWAAAPYGRRPVPLLATKPSLQVVRVHAPVIERIVAPAVVSLPVIRGEVLGRVEIWRGRKLLVSRPLVAGRSVAKPGVGGRLSFYAGRTVHHLLHLFR